jgi:hypothetical protein
MSLNLHLKKCAHKERILAGGVAVAVLLWLSYNLGYSLGYYHGHGNGLQEEQQAWEATLQVPLNSLTNRIRTTQSLRASCANPHRLPIYFVAGPTGRAARTVMNAPDPRIYRQYDHSTP